MAYDTKDYVKSCTAEDIQIFDIDPTGLDSIWGNIFGIQKKLRAIPSRTE